MILWSMLDSGSPLLLTYVLIFCLALAVIIFEYKKQARLFKKGAMKRIPGPIQIPVLGNIFQFANPGRENRLQKYLNIYSRLVHLGVVRFYLYDRLFIFVGVPEYLGMILCNVKIAKKFEEYKILGDSPLGEGLVSQLDVNIWKAHRKIITPTFHFNVLKTYIPVFQEETLNLISKLKNKLTKSDERSKEIVVLNVLPYVQLSAFDMILRNAFGVNIHAQENESHSFVSAMAEASNIIQQRIVKSWLLFDLVFSLFGYKRRQEQLKKVCYEFTESVIRTKRMEYQRKQQVGTVRGHSHSGHHGEEDITTSEFKSMDESGIHDERDGGLGYANNDKTVFVRGDGIHNDFDHEQEKDNVETERSVAHKSFLELIIENEENEMEKMSDEEIRDNVVTIIFAAQDTTATTNCCTLLMLSLHPEIQTQVQEEIDSIFGGPSLDDDHISSYSEILELHTLDRVIKETMRLYPASPFFGRALTSDVSMGPFILPAGANVTVLAIALHRDPNLHPRADEFWPDRFLPHNSGLIQRFSYMPFGVGSRNCVGQKYAMLQMKVVLSTILRKYRVSTDKSITSLTHVDKLVDVNFTLKMDRCPLVLTPRCNHSN